MSAAAALAIVNVPLAAQDKINVVTTLTTYADIARQIGGDLVEVTALADGGENPHHVQPKPSLVLVVKRADMLITTGLDLELWLPPLMDKANNRRVASGAPGFVAAAPGVKLMDVPLSLSRSEGDSHVFGNHHIWTEPANAVVIGRNILAGFKRVDPENADLYETRYAAWKEQVMRALVGEELVELLGVDLLHDLDHEGELWGFLTTQSYQGQPLIDRVGGWLGQTRHLRGKEMACYHKAWSYFTRSFGMICAAYVEPKPGIPPTPRHVAEVISVINERNLDVLFTAAYYDRDQVELVERRTGAKAVMVPLNTGGAPHTETFIDLMSLWIDELTEAFTDVTTVDSRP
jgi:ABC-type Zn uptake system ZnuABC Zn-binding protein ZnuA